MTLVQAIAIVVGMCVLMTTVVIFLAVREWRRRDQRRCDGCEGWFKPDDISPASGDYWFCGPCFDRYMRTCGYDVHDIGVGIKRLIESEGPLYEDEATEIAREAWEKETKRRG